MSISTVCAARGRADDQLPAPPLPLLRAELPRAGASAVLALLLPLPQMPRHHGVREPGERGYVDIRVDIPVDTHLDIRVDIRVAIRVDIRLDIIVDIRVDICVNILVDIRLDMCVNIHVDILLDI